MRIAVYHRSWGGDSSRPSGDSARVAVAIAEALSRVADRRVSLISHDAVDLATLGQRADPDLNVELGVDLDVELAVDLDRGRLEGEVVGPAPEAVMAASSRVDLFVNVGCADVASAAPHSFYVVGPPPAEPEPAPQRRRLLVEIGRRLAPPGTFGGAGDGASGRGVSVRDGLHRREWMGRLPVRWSAGDAVLEVPGEAPVTVLLGRFQPSAVGAVDVEAVVGGRVVARARVLPRTSRRHGLLTHLTVPPIGAGRHEVRLRSAIWTGGLPPQAPAPRATPTPPSTPTPTPTSTSTSTSASASASAPPPPPRSPSSPSSSIVAAPSPVGRRLGVAVVAAAGGTTWGRLAALAAQVLSPPATEEHRLDSYQLVLTSSAFAGAWVQRHWARHSEVLPPPVAARARVAKEAVIVAVDGPDGRGEPNGGPSRGLALIEAFRRLHASGPPNGDRGGTPWALHLLAEPGGQIGPDPTAAVALEAAAADLPVHVHTGPGPAVRAELYSRAALCWAATGFGEDATVHPERLEWFGRDVVAAMSAGAVPVVIAQGGLSELFEDGLAGYHWRTLDELVERSAELIANPVQRTFMADRAVEAAARFSPERFSTRLEELVARIVPRAEGPPR